MAGRTIAIGDIHGCSDALAAVLDVVAPRPKDTIVTLGDYIDRGPNSCGVIDRLIALAGQCRFVSLLGNHEEALLNALRDKNSLRQWLIMGGTNTLRSYGWVPGGIQRPLSAWFPRSHRAFIAGCRNYFETSKHLFVHAGYVPELPLPEQPPLGLSRRVTDAATAVPHRSGKVAIVGHTPQQSGDVLDLGFLICIDTNCARGGWLTALDVDTGQIWQADLEGRLRSNSVTV